MLLNLVLKFFTTLTNQHLMQNQMTTCILDDACADSVELAKCAISQLEEYNIIYQIYKI